MWQKETTGDGAEAPTLVTCFQLLLRYFPYSTQDPLPRSGTSHSGLGPPPSVNNNKINAHRHCLQANLMKAIPQLYCVQSPTKTRHRICELKQRGDWRKWVEKNNQPTHFSKHFSKCCCLKESENIQGIQSEIQVRHEYELQNHCRVLLEQFSIFQHISIWQMYF